MQADDHIGMPGVQMACIKPIDLVFLRLILQGVELGDMR